MVLLSAHIEKFSVSRMQYYIVLSIIIAIIYCVLLGKFLPKNPFNVKFVPNYISGLRTLVPIAVFNLLSHRSFLNLDVCPKLTGEDFSKAGMKHLSFLQDL